MAKSVNANALRELYRQQGKNVVLSADSVLTPSAKDLAKELDLNIKRGEVQVTMFSPSAQDVKLPVLPVQPASPPPAEADISGMVKRAVEDLLKPACPNPRAVHVRAADIVPVDFDKRPPGTSVTMTDVVTMRDANLDAGFMTYDKCQMPWHLTYDEIDYVVEGDFVLTVGNETFHAGPGDVLYIPADSHVIFSSPTKCKVFYVVYPANWEELCDK